MRKLMRLDEAIEKKIVKNLDKVDPNALFPKRIKKVILKTGVTGFYEPQEIRRQNFEYVFFKTRVKRDIKLSILAIGTEENKNTSVWLRGHIGYLWNSTCWREINEMYSNRRNGINAYSLTEEELSFLFERNKRFKGFKFATYINNTFRETTQKGSICGTKFVIGRSISNKVLWDPSEYSQESFFNYCPIIKIFYPSDILVDLSSMKKVGKWNLIPRKGLLKWWYRLF